jgi:hypothetical protein
MKIWKIYCILTFGLNVAQAQPGTYLYLVSRMKIKLNEESAQAQIRLREDSLVWISIRKAGIEGLRLLADPDSLVLSDPIHREVFVRSYTLLDSLLPGIKDIKSLQNLILGDEPELAKTEKQSKVSYYIKKNNDNKIRLFVAQDTLQGSKLSIQYLRYKRVKGYWVPKKLIAELYFDQQKIMIELESKKITLPEKRPDFYLKINKKYTRK